MGRVEPAGTGAWANDTLLAAGRPTFMRLSPGAASGLVDGGDVVDDPPIPKPLKNELPRLRLPFPFPAISRSLSTRSLSALSRSRCAEICISLSSRCLSASLCFSRSRSRSSRSRLSTRLRIPRSCWYTKKERRFATCSSRYASGRLNPFTLINRHRDGSDDSVYPSAL